jgi:RNA:NAD 2'-phosphotransferase (TPT1/KptA family)
MPEANSLPLDPKEEVQLSKLLSYLLRHGAIKEKLNISSDGFVAVNDIVSASNNALACGAKTNAVCILAGST